MMKSPLGKCLAVVTWFITALVSINEGAEAFGYGMKKLNFMVTRPELFKILHYVAGAAGLISLIMLIAACVCMGCHCCGHKNCICCNKGACDTDASKGLCPKCGANPCRCTRMN